MSVDISILVIAFWKKLGSIQLALHISAAHIVSHTDKGLIYVIKLS